MTSRRYVYPTALEAAQQCGANILRVLGENLAGGYTATLAISGGSTPRPMFEYMARTPFDWARVHIFWVDERPVPPDDPQSNFRLANETFLQPARIPVANIHRIEAERKPDEAAARYVEDMRSFFGLGPGDIPHFDVIHRGIGPDGHTASLFPGEPLIEDRKDLVAAVWVDKLNQSRITMLPAVLLAARETYMLVCGADKAEPVRTIFEGPFESRQYPAQTMERESRSSAWFFDTEAARLIEA